MRAGLAATVVLMLPFAWSEDATCDHVPRPPVSGLEILFGKGWEPGAIFLALLVVAVGLGFLARAAVRRRWLRLGAEVVAGLSGLVSFTMCILMMHHGREEQPLVYPAAWIGTVAAALLAFEAWWASGEALRGLVERRRAERALARAPTAGTGLPVRIAAACALEDREAEAEVEATMGEEEASTRRTR